MSKNLTRKGLAFGAIVALGSTLLAGAPAQALGQADNSFVSLAPSLGTEYTVLSGNTKTFDLTANESSTIAGGNLSFLVEDADGLIEPVSSSSTNYATGVVADWTQTATTISATVANTLKIGDIVRLTGLSAMATTSLGADDAATSVTELATVLTADAAGFTATAAGTRTVVAGSGNSVSYSVNSTGTVELVRSVRASNGSYVVNTGIATATTNEVLRLVQGDETTTRTVSVTAWVDSNGDRVINGTEFASPTRVVVFKKSTEVTATTTTDALIVGATSIVSHVTTTPALNGSQMSAGAVNAQFTYQGSAIEFVPATSSFNATTRAWDVTAERSFTITVAATPATLSSVLTTSFDLTATNGLTNGETVVVAGLTPTGLGADGLNSTNGSKVVSAVDLTANTFKISVGDDVTGYSLASPTAKVAIVAGAYSVTPKIGSDKIGAAASVGVVAVKAAAGTVAIAESSNVNTVVSGTDATATVRAKTLAVAADFTFKDAYGAVISAGRPVKVTVTTISGATGVKVNGTAVVATDFITLATDASGKVSAAVTATTAPAGAQVVLTAVAEGAATSVATLNWSTGTNYLYDLNNTDSLHRAISKGGSYSFDLALLDTWSQTLAGDYRVKVLVGGNTVSETYPVLTSGRATVVVADALIGTSNVTVDVTVQKKNTAGDWAAGTVDTIVLPSVVNFVLVPTAGTAALTAISADASVAFDTTALTVGDTRVSQAAISGDGTPGTNAIAITGSVTDSLTGTVRPGALVTISGNSSLAFIAGEKSAFGSITVPAAADGTYSVNVRSNKSQKDTVVTVAALGGTKTIKVTFEAAADETGTAITVDAPATAAAGKTVTVTVTLADKFGNAVTTGAGAVSSSGETPTVKVTYVGPGFVTSTIATSTDENGQVKFVVLLGAGDEGSAVITAKYDSNGTVDDVVGTTNSVTSTKTVLVGAAAVVPAVTASAAGIMGYVATTVRNASGKAVTVTVNGVVRTPRAPKTASELFRFRATAGKNTVVVKVDGMVVSSRTVMVK